MGEELAKVQKYTNKENLHIIKPTTELCELVHFPKLQKHSLGEAVLSRDEEK